MTGPLFPAAPDGAAVPAPEISIPAGPHAIAGFEPLFERDLLEDEEPLVLLEDAEFDSDLWLYRDRTAAMLRRYLRYSIEVGRLPSLLGREFFRTRVTCYQAATFEDAVIFVHDVQKCLAHLDEFENTLIARVVFQDYTQDEAAQLMGYQRRTVVRRFPEILDRLSELFLDGGLLTRLPVEKILPPESCQEGETEENELSDS